MSKILKRKQPALFGVVPEEKIVVKTPGVTFDYMQAAEYLKIRPRTLAKYREEGRLNFVKFSSRKIIYLKKDLDRFIEEHRHDLCD
jgi:hypothetical protein